MTAATIAVALVAVASASWALLLLGRLRSARAAAERSKAPAPGGPRGQELTVDEYRRRLRIVLDGVPDAFFHVDGQWRVTFLNKGALDMLERMERSGDDVLGTVLWEVFPRSRDAPVRAMLEGAMGERSSRSMELHSDTLGAWLLVRAFPSHDGLAVYVGDITERKEAERTLRETEERLRRVFEHAPEAVVVIDAESEKVVEFNQNAGTLFGRGDQKLRESMPFQFSPEHQPDGRRSVDAARDAIRRALDGETPVMEWIHLTGGGRRIDTEVSLVRIPSSDRKLIQANFRDITDRKRAEEALRESEERYRALFEQDVSGNFVTSVEGKILACNASFVSIYGFPSVEAAVGSDISRLYASPEQRHQLLDRIRTERRLSFYELPVRKLDGTTLHVLQNVQGVFDEAGRLVELRGHVVDVTERWMLEKQLVQAQRLEAVGRLAGGIAHDFNNLLTTITGHTDLLLTDDRLSPELHDDLRRIKRASKRAARLTGQLVAFSRKQGLQPVSLDLNVVVRDVVDMLHRTIGEDVRVAVNPDPDLWTVKADPGQLDQVLMNLAVNARDAMPRGGVLEISTRNEEIPVEADQASRRVDPGRYAVLEVSDTGEGIPDDKLRKIFDPFYTTKLPGKGSGLGLAMVYGIVRQSGGQVLVESEVGAGTTFTVLLPAEERREENERKGAGTGRGGEDGGWTVLLIQHDPVVRKLVRRILQREGHSVLEAEDPLDAVAFCREWQGPIHGIVSDLLSSEHEAMLREALKTHRPDARVLWTRESSTELEPRLGPGEGLLSKPFTSQELDRHVRALVGREQAAEAETESVG